MNTSFGENGTARSASKTQTRSTRREFLGAMGMTGLAAATAGIAQTTQANAKETSQTQDEQGEDGAASAQQQIAGSAPQEAVELTGWTGTPDTIAALGNSTMPLAELNRRRQEFIDQQTDFTCEDGTVIPAIYVKVAALISTYGFGGFGRSNAYGEKLLHYIMGIFTEDDAKAYLQMPRGRKFSAFEMSAESGLTEDECTEICDHLSAEGFMERYDTDDGVMYNQIAFIVGVLEYQIQRISDNAGNPDQNILMCVHSGDGGVSTVEDFLTCGTPAEYTIPCNKSIVADNEVLASDDIERIIRSKNRFVITPCYCRYSAMVEAGVDCPPFEEFVKGGLEDYFSPLCNQRVETCLFLGHLADYYIDRGIGREITMEQALEYVKRSVDDGFIIQSIFSQSHEAICSCHIDSCKLFTLWTALGDPAKTAATPAFQQVSHYELHVDLDTCIGCGTCVDRCPVHAVTMDEQTGKPTVNEMCFRCGQCCVTCPVGARKLTARPEELNAPLPIDQIEDHNNKAAYRFEHGLVR